MTDTAVRGVHPGDPSMSSPQSPPDSDSCSHDALEWGDTEGNAMLKTDDSRSKAFESVTGCLEASKNTVLSDEQRAADDKFQGLVRDNRELRKKIDDLEGDKLELRLSIQITQDHHERNMRDFAQRQKHSREASAQEKIDAQVECRIQVKKREEVEKLLEDRTNELANLRSDDQRMADEDSTQTNNFNSQLATTQGTPGIQVHTPAMAALVAERGGLIQRVREEELARRELENRTIMIKEDKVKQIQHHVREYRMLEFETRELEKRLKDKTIEFTHLQTDHQRSDDKYSTHIKYLKEQLGRMEMTEKRLKEKANSDRTNIQVHCKEKEELRSENSILALENQHLDEQLRDHQRNEERLKAQSLQAELDPASDAIQSLEHVIDTLLTEHTSILGLGKAMVALRGWIAKSK